MTVSALGTAPLSYQWFFQGAELSGETSSTLFIQHVQETDEGVYKVRVTNGLSQSVMSNEATLTVNDPPLITLAPVCPTVNPGELAILRVEADSQFAMTFQWYKDNVALIDDPGHYSGSNSNRLQFLHTLDTDEGEYHVCITNQAGVTCSDPCILLVGQPLTVDAFACPGDQYINTPELRLEARIHNGKGTRTYQWFKNGTAVSAPNTLPAGVDVTARLTLRDLTQADAADYFCRVDDQRASDPPVDTNVCSLGVYSHLGTPTILGDAVLNITAPAPLQLEVTITPEDATGVPPLHYEWKVETGSKAILTVGGDSPFLMIDPTDPSDSGEYWAVVDDAGADAPKDSNRITVSVELAVPVATGLGLAAFAGVSAALGALAMRRRKK